MLGKINSGPKSYYLVNLTTNTPAQYEHTRSVLKRPVITDPSKGVYHSYTQVLWLKCIPKSDDLMRTYEHHIGASRLFSDFPTV